MERSERTGTTGVLRAGLLYGSLWGLAEATLGYLLHLALLSSVSGMVMFPVGFSLMVGAYRSSGRTGSILLCTVVATAVKLSSLVLPVVSFTLVRNPTLAILLEGLVAFAGVSLFGLPRGLRLFPPALAVSLAWRGLFLLASLALGLRGGILSKGPTALALYLALEPAVNAALITGFFAVPWRARLPACARLPRPNVAVVILTCVAALAGELTFALL